MFLRNYLTQLKWATAYGVPMKGYFQRSTMDNFEWTAGYGNRSDWCTSISRRRNARPKRVPLGFREMVRQNAVV